MELAPLLVGTLLIGAYTTATAFIYRRFPLWLFGLGQQHGRYAGLGSADSKSGGDSGKMIPVLPLLAAGAPSIGLMVA